MAYGLFSITGFVRTVRDALHAKFVFEEKLGISSRKLEGGAIEWHEVVEKIVEKQRSGEFRVAIHGEDIDPLIVAQRILRRENFMVAFFNQGLLDLSLPLSWPLGENGGSARLFFSKSLEVRSPRCRFLSERKLVETHIPAFPIL